jgi:hypothetical protein
MKKLVALLVLAILASGCLGNAGTDGAEADEVRDSFIDNDVSSYVYEGETSYSFGTQGGPTRATTITIEATVNRSARELDATVDSVTEGAGERTASNTTTYLLNGTVYSRTVRDGNSTGWVPFEGDAEVNNTWDARDELRLYEDVLENATVEHNGTETVRGKQAHRLEVELGENRTDLLLGKFRESPEFFNQAETRSFVTTVWITDGGNLLRAETEATMVLRGQQTRSGERDITVELGLTDSFRYDERTAVEPPTRLAEAIESR